MILSIGPLRVPVVEEASENLFGCFEGYPARIMLKEGMNPATRATTLIHELLHLWSSVYGLNLSEAKVRTLENCFTDLMVNHPDLVMGFVEAVRDGVTLAPVEAP